MAPSASPNQSFPWNIVGPLGAGVLLSLLALLWVPWERVHPSDASLRESIGYAPLWTHRFDGVPGSHVDWTAFLINLMVIWVICIAAALLLNMSGRTEK